MSDWLPDWTSPPLRFECSFRPASFFHRRPRPKSDAHSSNLDLSTRTLITIVIVAAAISFLCCKHLFITPSAHLRHLSHHPASDLLTNPLRTDPLKTDDPQLNKLKQYQPHKKYNTQPSPPKYTKSTRNEPRQQPKLNTKRNPKRNQKRNPKRNPKRKLTQKSRRASSQKSRRASSRSRRRVASEPSHESSRKRALSEIAVTEQTNTTEETNTTECRTSTRGPSRLPTPHSLPDCESDDFVTGLTEELLENASALAAPLVHVEDYAAPPRGCSGTTDVVVGVKSDTVISLLTLWSCAVLDKRDVLAKHRPFQPVNIGVATQVNRITYADISSGTWGVMLTHWYTWSDQRLLFDGADYCAAWESARDFLEVPIDRMKTSAVWAPDMVNVNTVDPEIWASQQGQMEQARLYDRGFWRQNGFNVAWRTTETVHAVCDYAFDDFPFDEQVCSVVTAPLAHSTEYVRQIPRRWQVSFAAPPDAEAFRPSNTVHHYENLDASSAIRILHSKIVFSNPTVNPTITRRQLVGEDVSYSELVVYFTRDPTYLVLNYVYPLVVMWLLAYTTFFLPFEDNDRLAIVMAIVWTCTAIMFISANHKPANFRDTWSDIFQAGSLILCTFPGMEAVFVSRLKTHIQDRISIRRKRHLVEREDADRRLRAEQLHRLQKQYYFSRIDSGPAEPFEAGDAPGWLTRKRELSGSSLGMTLPTTDITSSHWIEPATHDGTLITEVSSVPLATTGDALPTKRTSHRLAYLEKPESTTDDTTTSAFSEDDSEDSDDSDSDRTSSGSDSSSSGMKSAGKNEEAEVETCGWESDACALSNLIDRVMQVVYPGAVIAFAFNRIYVLENRRLSSASFMVILMSMIMFMSMWLVALVSYATKLRIRGSQL